MTLRNRLTGLVLTGLLGTFVLIFRTGPPGPPSASTRPPDTIPPPALPISSTSRCPPGGSTSRSAPASLNDETLLPGSALEFHQAVEQAEIIAIGRELWIGMGGSFGGSSVFMAEVHVEECLKGDLPPGRLKIGVTIRPPESLPLAEADETKAIEEYLFFIHPVEKDGVRGHRVLKMILNSEANRRAVRSQLDRRIIRDR